MIPWFVLDVAAIEGGGELRLKRRGSEFSIMLGSVELMNSRVKGSEESLATVTCQRLRHLTSPTVLIGGLGMGFTLRAALAGVGPQARIIVAELVPAVVAWARGPMAEIFNGSLDDPRVEIRESDVGALLAASVSAYDAILLDIDNGPEGLTREQNDRLYDLPGLSAAKHALRPGGVLAVWSSAPDAGFSRRLRTTGFSVEEIGVRANAKRGRRHWVWLATKAEGVSRARR